MKTIWTAGLKDEDKAKFKEMLQGSRPILERLVKILSDMNESISRKGMSEDDYKTMDWTHVQAFRNGQISMVRQIVDILDLGPNKL